MIFFDICEGCSKFSKLKKKYAMRNDDCDNICSHLGYKSDNDFFQRHSSNGCLREEKQRERFEEEKKKIALSKVVCKSCHNKHVGKVKDWILSDKAMLWDEHNDQCWDENLECACPSENDSDDDNYREKFDIVSITSVPDGCLYKLEHDIMLSDED